MGAADFQKTQFGKTAEDAFRQAREQALYDHGHGGYTGTIAEKRDFREVPLPPRHSPYKFIGWASRFYDEEEMKKANIPKEHWSLVRRMSEIYDDKWGPALCVKVTGKWDKELRRKNSHLKGKSGDSL